MQILQTIAVRKMVYLSLGSNVGDRKDNLRVAIERIADLGDISAVSSIYETEPVEYTNQPWFLNCVVRLETEKMPRQLLSQLVAIEHKMGRRRSPAGKPKIKGPRTIDIDILLFGHSVVDIAGLTIPHPAMHERRFVLEPLAEIAPEERHPVLKRTIRELREMLPAGPPVVKRFAG